MELSDLGEIRVSSAAVAALAGAGVAADVFLDRHRRGDVEGAVPERQRLRDWALRYDSLVFSTYKLRDDANLLIGTARDRSYTRVMLETEFERREASTQEGYALWADYYDHERNPLIAVEGPIVDAILDDMDVTTALDVGAGTGRLSLKLARRGISVLAIDPSPEMLAQARANADREGLAIELHSGSLETGLPSRPSGFDRVVCALALCHVMDLRRAACELSRVVRVGGYLLITDFHPGSVAIGWRTHVTRPEGTYWLPNMPHTRADYLESIVEAGCAILGVHDVPVREVPQGYLAHHEELMQEQGDVPLCLVVLAQKPGH
jgi:SAM-dependent methyltransferase